MAQVYFLGRWPLSAKGVIEAKEGWKYSLNGKHNFISTIIHAAANPRDWPWRL